MRFVIADASPIHYLVLLGLAAYLERLYERILIPQTVAQELTAGQAPKAVRQWLQLPPPWLEVVADAASDETRSVSGSIDAGELAVITLALKLKPGLVLMDDRAGVKAANHHRLEVTGTLGILSRFSELGWIDLESTLDELRKTNFRAHPKLIRILLDAHKGEERS